MIPKVTRTPGGVRDYQEEDLKWVEHAICMRNAGLPIETLTEYLDLFQQGDETIPKKAGIAEFPNGSFEKAKGTD